MNLAARRLERLAEGGSDTARILWADLSGDATVLPRMGEGQSPLLLLERAALALGTGVGPAGSARLEELGDLPSGLEQCRADLLLRLGSSAMGDDQDRADRQAGLRDSEERAAASQETTGGCAADGGELQEWLTRVQSWREVLGV